MVLDKDSIQKIMNNPALIRQTDRYSISKVVEEYPWFQEARMIWIKKLQLENNPDFETELNKAALNLSDRTQLFNLLKLEIPMPAQVEKIPEPVTAAEKIISPAPLPVVAITEKPASPTMAETQTMLSNIAEWKKKFLGEDFGAGKPAERASPVAANNNFQISETETGESEIELMSAAEQTVSAAEEIPAINPVEDLLLEQPMDVELSSELSGALEQEQEEISEMELSAASYSEAFDPAELEQSLEENEASGETIADIVEAVALEELSISEGMQQEENDEMERAMTEISFGESVADQKIPDEDSTEEIPEFASEATAALAMELEIEQQNTSAEPVWMPGEEVNPESEIIDYEEVVATEVIEDIEQLLSSEVLQPPVEIMEEEEEILEAALSDTEPGQSTEPEGAIDAISPFLGEQSFSSWLKILQQVKYFPSPAEEATKTQAALPEPETKIPSEPTDETLIEQQHEFFSDENADENLEAIDRFVSELYVEEKKEKSISADEIARRSSEDAEDIVTETLANVYAAQGKYEKAIRLLDKLSLAMPEKLIYFATRIEELKKNL